jgi:hypothetical protein
MITPAPHDAIAACDRVVAMVERSLAMEHERRSEEEPLSR